jgi:8-oxo-dGTP pyrophosphatase MutT (NUDIX family)
MKASWNGAREWKDRIAGVFSPPADPPWEKVTADGPGKSAVLVPFFPGPDGPELLFLRRSATLRHHAGEICFPGGMREPGDFGPVSTALRETAEETGIRPECVETLGILEPEYAVVSGVAVFPVVGLVSRFKPADLDLSSGETEGACFAGVDLFPDVPVTKTVEVRGTLHEYPEYRLENGWIIWGVTARILRRVLGSLKGGMC